MAKDEKVPIINDKSANIATYIADSSYTKSNTAFVLNAAARSLVGADGGCIKGIYQRGNKALGNSS